MKFTVVTALKSLSVNELIDEATLTPGAVMSGFMRSSMVGPSEEKAAIAPPAGMPPMRYSEL